MANNLFYQLKSYSKNPIATDDSGGQLSIKEFIVFNNKLESILSSNGLVFCLCNNSIDSLIGYLVFLNRGLVPLLLDANKDTSTLENLYEIYKPNYMWIPDNFNSLKNLNNVLFEYRGYLLL